MNTPSKFAETFFMASLLSILNVPAMAQVTAAEYIKSEDKSSSATTVRGLLVPATESILSSQVAAQINKISVNEGQRFKKGDVLVKFECAENRAEARKARAELDAATKKHQSNEKLLQHRAINSLEVDISKANLNRAKAQLNLMNARVRYCSIIAPYSGRVTKLGANQHDMVTLGQPIIEILDDSKLKMELYVPSRWLTWLEKDQEFSVQIDETGKTYPATVKGLGSRVDPVSQTLALYAEITGTYPELLAGMSGVATFPGAEGK